MWRERESKCVFVCCCGAKWKAEVGRFGGRENERQAADPRTDSLVATGSCCSCHHRWSVEEGGIGFDDGFNRWTRAVQDGRSCCEHPLLLIAVTVLTLASKGVNITEPWPRTKLVAFEPFC